jgi:hypothetical protein
MTMKTSELQGTALDWAVAKCEGYPDLFDMDRDYGIKVYRPFDEFEYFEPSTNWEQGGPIIEREKIALFLNGNDEWAATDGIKNAVGDTPLIAAMRCYVASKLGNEIELPEELNHV